MMMLRIIFLFLFNFCVLNVYAWNALGHKVVAQIAFDNLSPNALAMYQRYFHTRSNHTTHNSFIASATWMDRIRTKKIYWYDGMHYIDIPYSSDAIALPVVERTNAVWAIQNAITVLSAKYTNSSDKQLALKMLIHVVGDIHQPLHAVTKVSTQLPQGDLGGNLFPLGTNSVGTNLHKYWDNGAGLFQKQKNKNQYQNIAHHLERKWSCDQINSKTHPELWAQKSHDYALNTVYQINPHEVPSAKYQALAQNLVQKRVVFAGCRLAYVLNQIAK